MSCRWFKMLWCSCDIIVMSQPFPYITCVAEIWSWDSQQHCESSYQSNAAFMFPKESVISWKLNINTEPHDRWVTTWSSFPGAWGSIRYQCQGPDSVQRCHLNSIGFFILEIRQSLDHLISTMEIPILVRWHLYIELEQLKHLRSENTPPTPWLPILSI